MLAVSNRPRTLRLSNFEITRTISVQLLLLIVLVILNQPHALCSSDFEITCMISLLSGTRSPGCPITGVRFELFVIGYL